MQEYEKLGAFYMGRAYDIEKRETTDDVVLYDSKDLVTHAVCVGMTGSGKTGLCIGVLEEAAIDGVPSLVIDPKGDLSNLMLTFPDLAPSDFRPWINEDDARRKGLSPDEYAGAQAKLWKEGLDSWGQKPERIRRLREAADFSVYTPGSSAGLPLSILKSFSAPPRALMEDGDLMRERVRTTATSLLGLLGIDADPIRSREHILLSNILHHAWMSEQDLDLGGLIAAIQTPPIQRVGVMDLESFYPAKDRFELAMALNNLLAAPGFGSWLEGEALDVGALLRTSAGKPRVSIFSIAHLSEAERMFFVSLLLNEVLGWMRTQSGTTSLRALVYMDEIAGYCPPTANPPSKAPLLSLMKQARAYGLGVMLATQNPVDLDYKGLSNAGTWYVGRLQTERDRLRLLDGLEGAMAGSGGGFDRAAIERILDGLGKRVFLLHNVHEDGPEVFQTRWVMSYLRGPLTRDQIKVLMDPRKAQLAAAPANTTGTVKTAPAEPVAVAPAQAAAAAGNPRPVLPPEIRQVFLPQEGTAPAGSSLHYRPQLVGIADVAFASTRAGVDTEQHVQLLAPLESDPGADLWDEARPTTTTSDRLTRAPVPGASFAAVPAAAGKARSYRKFESAFKTWIYKNQRVEVFQSPKFKLYSQVGEGEGEFRGRLADMARETLDEQREKLRKRYAPKLARLEERILKAEQRVEKEQEQKQHHKLQTVISVGATVLGAFLGRKKVSVGNIGKATTAARSASRIGKEGEDVRRAQESLEALKLKLEDLDAEFQEAVEELEDKIEAQAEELKVVSVKPKKADIDVSLLALAWTPYWRQPDGTIVAAWR